jgi:RNA polymerase sigma factor (sigma-70 family)
MEASALHPPHSLAASPRLLRLAGDDRLVALVRAGNERAFEVVYDRYHRQLLSFCRHMLGRADEAEDAVQQTFISAHADLNRSDRPIALRAWLFTIARNRCLSILRARRETATLEDVEPETGGLADEVQQREDLRTMLGDIAHLPEDQRAALVLAELGDLDHGDIADVVGCPKEKVKALVFQARSSLALSRQARETSCEEIREQLATLRGGALRRTALRRHLRGCTGCREFRDEVRRQRSAMALLLPVVPAAGLKKSVLAGAGLSASGAGAGAGSGAAGIGAAGAKLAVLKSAVAIAIVGAGAAGGAAVVQQIESQSGTSRHGAAAASHPREAAAGTAVSSAAASAAAGSVSATAHGRAAGGSSAAHSNRAAAHQNALAHGRGLKRGLLGTQPGHNKTSTSSHGQGQGVGRGGHGQGSTGSPKSNANSEGNGQGHDGTSSSGNASRGSNPNANPNVAAPAESGSTDPSPSGSSRGHVNGQN